MEKTLSPCVLDKEKRRRHFIKSTLLLSVRIIHTHSINNKYVCHQFFFFNYSVPNPSATRVLFSMRVRWPTRVRFISISIDDDERRVYVAFYPRAKTQTRFTSQDEYSINRTYNHSLFCECDNNIINNNNTQVENGF